MINDNRISLLFGLPGAGKTTALTKVLTMLPNLVRLSVGLEAADDIDGFDRLIEHQACARRAHA